MNNQNIYKIISNDALTKDVYKMILSGDTSRLTAPGQFINILVEDNFLRRPISVCDYDDITVTIIYKVVGKGTKEMSQMSNGGSLDVLSGLGNGYSIADAKHPLVIGGGVGIPPLYNLTKKLVEKGQTPTVILGFNTKDEVFYEDEFKAISDNVIVTTADGSYGIKGFVTNALPQSYDYFYTCGPLPMLKAVYDSTNTSGQLSFEERMGCGFGACMGCSCKTKYGSKRICKDGPVLVKEEIIW